MSKFRPVFDAVKPLFKDLGFRKSANSFYRVSNDTLTVVNFQGSTGGNGFYVNFGSQPFDSDKDPKKLKTADLRIKSHRISLFRQAGDWRYDMGDVERAILSRKLEEQVSEVNAGVGL